MSGDLFQGYVPNSFEITWRDELRQVSFAAQITEDKDESWLYQLMKEGHSLGRVAISFRSDYEIKQYPSWQHIVGITKPEPKYLSWSDFAKFYPWWPRPPKTKEEEFEEKVRDNWAKMTPEEREKAKAIDNTKPY